MTPAQKPELLAPAGGMESVYAAVRCGADAVYLGAKAFSARQSAHNFDDAALEQAVRYCHLHGVRVYQALNTLVFDAELPAVEHSIRAAATLGVDALIVQDLGVANLAAEICPQMPLHASTQMTIHTADGVRMLETLGFKRVVLSRELSLREIREIRAATDLALEVFVHGALCMSMSGQCYFSAMLGGRSGNRGMCAQPCRLPFSADRKPAHLLSLKDLCAVEQIGALREIGVDSLKIEGRMKRPEYVAAAVSVYRRALDEGKVDPAEADALRAVFSRSGFTDGYLTNRRGKAMFGVRGKEDVTAAAGVLKSLQNRYAQEPAHIPLRLSFVLRADEPIRLTVSDNTHTVSAAGEPPETAVRVALSDEQIRAALGKWGGTPFFAADVALERDPQMTVPVSAVNRLRRSCAEQLSALRAAPHAYPLHPSRPVQSVAATRGTHTFWGRFADWRPLSDYAIEHFSKLVLPMELLLQTPLPDAIREKAVAELPRAAFGGDARLYRQLCALKERGISAVLAGNLASVYTARRAGLSVHGGFSLNLTNSRSLAVLRALGAESVFCSPELTAAQLRGLSAELAIGMFAYGRLPLMLTRNCPVGAQTGCADCRKQTTLYDRKGIAFPVACTDGAVELFNSMPIYMADRLRELPSGNLLLYFTDEAEPDSILRAYLTAQPPAGGYTRGLYYRGVL